MDEVPPGAALSERAGTERAGNALHAARDRLGLSLGEVAARTRVPLRHLEAIEAGDYAGLPSHTYATGFAKAYARAVGVDEVAVAAQVRGEVARSVRRQPEYQPYAMADPARVPSRGLAMAAAGVAIAVLVLVGLWFGTDLLHGSTSSTYTPPAAIVAAPDAAPGTAAIAAPAVPATAGGQVTLAATDEVWMRIYDADDKTLYLGTMKPGSRFDLPAGAKNPMINVGRPDQLRITLNGAAVPALGTGERPIKNVRIGPAALAARIAGASTAASKPAPAVAPGPAASPTSSTTPSPSPSHERSHSSVRPRRPLRSRRPLDETQRANLDAARAAATTP